MAEANKLAILSAKTGVPVKTLVAEALAKHNRIEDAARDLGISRQALSYYLNHTLPREAERDGAGAK